MNWLDVAIVLVIAWFTFAAFGAGIIREVVTVIAFVVAVLAAGFYYDDLAENVLLFIDDDIVEVFLILFTTFPYLGLDSTIRGSAIAPLFLDGGPVLLKLLPGEFDAAVDAF
jgi:hypothetical protein